MSDCKTQAISCLAKFFSDALIESNLSMRNFEDFVCIEGTKVLATAANKALEMFDDMLYSQHSQHLKVKERRTRTLA